MPLKPQMNADKRGLKDELKRQGRQEAPRSEDLPFFLLALLGVLGASILVLHFD
jgi:hypothetical protein